MSSKMRFIAFERHRAEVITCWTLRLQIYFLIELKPYSVYITEKGKAHLASSTRLVCAERVIHVLEYMKRPSNQFRLSNPPWLQLRRAALPTGLLQVDIISIASSLFILQLTLRTVRDSNKSAKPRITYHNKLLKIWRREKTVMIYTYRWIFSLLTIKLIVSHKPI